MSKWLDEVKARAESATPGPWRQESYLSGTEYIRFQTSTKENSHGDGTLGCHMTYRNIAAFDMSEDECDRRKHADANFIAHARTDVPLLISKLEAAERALDKVALLMRGAPSIAPMTDQMVLKLAEDTLAELRKDTP